MQHTREQLLARNKHSPITVEAELSSIALANVGTEESETNRSAAYVPWTNGILIASDPRVRFRLFCFPYAGGGTSAFRDWPAQLPAEVQLCPIQLPGRESRWSEPAYSDLFHLVSNLSVSLAPLMDLPFAFFGHSMGALIAFELARELRKTRRKLLAALFVSGCRAPQVPDLDPLIGQLPDEDFIRELRKLNGIPDQILRHPDYVALVLPTLRSDLTLYETYHYHPEEPLPCLISAFAGQDDLRVPWQSVGAWKAQTCASFSFRIFPGDHFFLYCMQDEFLRSMVSDLSTVLEP